MKRKYCELAMLKGMRKAKTRTRTAVVLTTASLLIGGGGGLSLMDVGTTYAAPAPQVVYNSIPSPQPSNVPSQAYEATSTSEFGGQIGLAGTNRTNPTVKVLMSSWACQAGTWNNDNCVSASNATFTHPVTLNIYSVGASNSVGSLLASKTQTFTMPYRPSADDTNCTGANAGEWYDGTSCYNGKAFTISFDFTGVTLPNDAIVTAAYNTSDYGASPMGDNTTCHATAEGCPYDSLNVGTNPSATVGTPLPTANDAYLSSTWSGAYCDSSETTGTLHLDPGCWTGYLPAFEVTATQATVVPPTHYSQCRNQGWKQFNDPSYSDQANCIYYVWQHSEQIDGTNVKYTAYGLSREANFSMYTSLNRGYFDYQDANHDWYDVKVSDVSVSGNNGYFAGEVTKASNQAWVGNWLFGEVQNGHPYKIWGSFTDQTTAQNGVDTMTSSPVDGPFTVTQGEIFIRH